MPRGLVPVLCTLRSFGEPLGGTGGGTFDFTMAVFCLSGGSVIAGLFWDGAVVTIGFERTADIVEGAAVVGVAVISIIIFWLWFMLQMKNGTD